MHEAMQKSMAGKHENHAFRMYETMQIRHTVVKKIRFRKFAKHYEKQAQNDFGSSLSPFLLKRRP
jgi:hypothetical protein